jgi:hypothetical protein
MTNTCNISFALLKHLTDSAQLKQYAYFIRFKYQFSNSLYYKFNANKLARLNGITHKVSKKVIMNFLSRGWCRLEHGHLKFATLQQLCKIEKVESKTTIKISVDINDHKQIKLMLQRVLLEDNLRKQEFICTIKRDLINPTNLKAHKSARKKAQRLDIQPGETANQPMISVYRLSQLFNCSKASAQRIKQQFQKLRWFEFLRQIHRIASGITKLAYKKSFQPYFDKSVFYFKGAVYQSMPCLVYRMQD